MRNGKGRFSEEVKTVIVQCLACFETPSNVVDAIRKEIRRTITHQSVEGYHPAKKAGSNLAAKCKVLLEDPQDLPRGYGDYRQQPSRGSAARSDASQRTGQGAAALLLKHAGKKEETATHTN